MKKLSVLLGVLALGCAVKCPESSPLIFDWQGSDEGLAIAHVAIAEWNDLCQSEVIVGRHNGGVPMVETTEPLNAPEYNLYDLAGLTRFDKDHTLVSITVIKSADFERPAIAHEVGHALGLGHSSDGIMTPSVRPDSHVTTADCQRLPLD